MQFHHLEYFIQAVECKSLNRASRKLNVSLQALCAGIAALEKSLGYPLLIRSRNGVSPTQNGEIVFRDAAGFSELVQKWRALSPVETERQVMVKFGASTTLMRWLVPQVILRTQQRQPHIYFDFYESFVENVFANLLDRHSLGLITAINERVEGVYRIRLMQNDMEYTVGPEDRCVVVINRKHPFAQLPSLTRAQLRELKLVWTGRTLRLSRHLSVFLEGEEHPYPGTGKSAPDDFHEAGIRRRAAAERPAHGEQHQRIHMREGRRGLSHEGEHLVHLAAQALFRRGGGKEHHSGHSGRLRRGKDLNGRPDAAFHAGAFRKIGNGTEDCEYYVPFRHGSVMVFSNSPQATRCPCASRTAERRTRRQDRRRR